MSELKDLGFTSIGEMSDDEGIEHLRRIRLSRRVPEKSRKANKTTKKATSTKQPKMTKAQAEALLKLLEEE